MYDITIIGSGWAGYSAAREAALLGKSVCLIENSFLGGTCLNAGCIPTKILVQSAKLLSKTRKAAEFGVLLQSPSIDMAAVLRRKERIVTNLRKGMESRLKGVDRVQGEAEIAGPGKVGCAGKEIETRSIIICSGSEPRPLDGFPFDGTRVISSDDALRLERVPGSMLIIGGGIIGCEFASIFSAFGSKVTVAEACTNLLPGMDHDIARRLESSLRRRGITVMTGADVSAMDTAGFEVILVAVGRRPRAAGAEHAGVTVEKGRIKIDEHCATTLAGVYAAGDCTGKLMLAHYAALQGRIAARNAAGINAFMPSVPIPSCVFTSPEICAVGLSEEEAMKRGVTVKEYQFDFLGSGMAHVMGETEGMLKMLVDTKTDAVAGACMIGPDAAELSGMLTLAVQHGMKAQQLRETVYAHPSLSESAGEMLH